MRKSSEQRAEERRERQFDEMCQSALCGRPRGVPRMSPDDCPDDKDNDDRAEWAEAALRAFCLATGVDTTFNAVGDLIADLGHWCDRHQDDTGKRLSMAACIANGREHYEFETNEKGAQFNG